MHSRKQQTLPFSASASRPRKHLIVSSGDNAEIGSLDFSFIDLFAGIGGLRIGLEKAGGRCVFSCEIDPYAQKTYAAWSGEAPVGDINDFVDGRNVPEHELLAAGFPCQPFSVTLDGPAVVADGPAVVTSENDSADLFCRWPANL